MPLSVRVVRASIACPRLLVCVLSCVCLMASAVGAQTSAPPAEQPVPPRPPDYVIGPEDVLGVLVWGEKDLSIDVTVRPDGYISLPLINDVLATGKTPDQMRDHLQQLLRAYIRNPNVTLIVRDIRSRKVSITGQVAKPGTYPLLSPMRALDLIAQAGGLLPSADPRHLSVLRNERSGRTALPLDYSEVSRGLRIWQDIMLRPGDTLVVP